MLEIIMVLILSRRNGKRATEKGYSGGYFTFITAISYLAGEVMGGAIGYILMPNNIMAAYTIALAGGITGGVIASMAVVKLKSKTSENLDGGLSFNPDEPDAVWECPLCKQENNNWTFECVECGYRLN